MSTFEARCERRRQGPYTIAGVVFAVTGATALLVMAWRAPDPVFAISMATELLLVALGYAWWVVQRVPNARRVPIDVSASSADLRIGDETIDARTLGECVVQQVDDMTIVRLARGWRPPIDIVVADVEQGRALLRAIGRDASQAVVRFYAASRMLAFAGVLFATFVVLLPVLGFISVIFHSVAPCAALVLLAFVMFAWPSRVDIGPDGVQHDWLAWRTFIPSKQITSVARAPTRSRLADIEVARGEEEPHHVYAMGASVAALEERIRDIAGQTAVENAPHQLVRGGMPAREWIATLRALASQGATYRSASLDVEALWRIVEAPTASPQERAGAAVAVARDENARSRLRVAASAIAEPKLRVAVEAAASDDGEALEQALDDLREL